MTNGKTSIILIIFSILITFCTVYFYTFPKWKKYNENKVLMDTKQKELEQVKSEVTNYSKITDKKDEIITYANKTSDLVPTDAKLEQYLIDLESQIAQSKIPSAEFNLTTLSAATSTNSPSIIKAARNFQMTISGSSSLPNILEFINQLRNMPRLTEITSLDLTTSIKNKDINFVLTGNIFSDDKKNTTSVANPKKILEDAIAKITNYQTSSQVLEVQKEEGFGRANPFLSY